jgi:hypothetical protein
LIISSFCWIFNCYMPFYSHSLHWTSYKRLALNRLARTMQKTQFYCWVVQTTQYISPNQLLHWCTESCLSEL